MNVECVMLLNSIFKSNKRKSHDNGIKDVSHGFLLYLPNFMTHFLHVTQPAPQKEKLPMNR